MKTSIPGRRFQHLRPVAFLAGLLLALAGAPQEAGAMWVGLTDAELQQQSVLVVDGEWVGEGAWPGRTDGARLGAIAVKATLQGKADGNLVFVQRPPASRPISSSDLSVPPRRPRLVVPEASTRRRRSRVSFWSTTRSASCARAPTALPPSRPGAGGSTPQPGADRLQHRAQARRFAVADGGHQLDARGHA
jgi:hypothetical protein